MKWKIARAAGALLAVVALGLGLGVQAAAAPAVDPAALGRLEQKIRSGELANVHGVLVLQHGKPLAEWYFAGRDEMRGTPLGQVTFTPATLHDARSMSKSMVSLLFGIAVSEGAIKSLDTPVLDYFPEYPALRTPERIKIRVRDLLSMTSGVAWDEDTYSYADPRNSETAMDLADDRFHWILTQKIIAPPGETWRYSGGDVALAAAILARATKTPLEVYAQKKLWGPLGITTAVWLKDPKGVPYSASGVRMTLGDMGRIGQMVLDHGRWKGRQVVPAAWIAASTSSHAQVQPDPKCGTRYGYFWWLGAGCAATPPTPTIGAVGNGGQRIWIVPSRDLVVVSIAGNYNGPTQGKVANAILAGVLEAVPAH
jgi:CubicO group peptidase (beta-lactamase class C family)